MKGQAGRDESSNKRGSNFESSEAFDETLHESPISKAVDHQDGSAGMGQNSPFMNQDEL